MRPDITQESARLVASKMLRTSSFHRPNPSLFFFPGLSQQPYYKARDFSFTKDFENNFKTIQDEYWALRGDYGEGRDDYTKNDGEHTLNEGTWKWMNYVERGKRTN